VAETQQPLSRQSLADVTARAHKALGKPLSRSTVWRILDTDAIPCAGQVETFEDLW
jgi:hypothetical protein